MASARQRILTLCKCAVPVRVQCAMRSIDARRCSVLTTLDDAQMLDDAPSGVAKNMFAITLEARADAVCSH